jgi:hypothetical protein
MEMSIRTTSGVSDAASSTAFSPLCAWPTTSNLSSVARIAARASAKSRWSSAIRTRILVGTAELPEAKFFRILQDLPPKI